MDVNKNEFLLPNMIKGKVDTNNQEIFRYSITTSDVLIARTSETIKEIAYSSCLLENIANCTYSGFLLKASPKIKNIIFPPYIVLLLRSQIYRKRLMKLSTETSRALINSDNLAKLIINISKFKEQKKIWLFFNLLLKKITITEQKIETLKKYKEGLISRGLKLIIGNNKFVKFKSLFEEYNVKNEEDFLPYTVGKYGLKQIQDFNYSISNHKVFKPNSLLIGLGIEEIAFSTKTTGSVSPVYNVYSLKSCCDDSFVDIFLKPLLWIKKAFITKKSTRREFEIDKKALENMKIPYLNSNEIKYLCYSIKKVDKLIETLMDKKDKLDLCKKYLLEAMFI